MMPSIQNPSMGVASNSSVISYVADEETIKSDSTVFALPLLNATKVANLSANTIVSVISKVGKWKYIMTSEASGWIFENSGNNAETNTNPNETETNNQSDTNNQTETNNETETNNQTEVNNETNNETTVNNNIDENASQEGNEYPAKMYVNVEAVNVREQSSTDSDVIASLELNDEITVTGVSGDWYMVELNGSKGYIKKDYLSSTKK